jgi:hypothetical protein
MQNLEYADATMTMLRKKTNEKEEVVLDAIDESLL